MAKNSTPHLFQPIATHFESTTIAHTTECFHLPFLESELVAFSINSDSMSPTLAAGDIVLCTPLLSFNDLEDNRLYAIVTEQFSWVKRVQRCLDTQDNITHLRLISDNIVKFVPFFIDFSEVKNIFKVYKRVANF